MKDTLSEEKEVKYYPKKCPLRLFLSEDRIHLGHRATRPPKELRQEVVHEMNLTNIRDQIEKTDYNFNKVLGTNEDTYDGDAYGYTCAIFSGSFK